MSVTIKTPNPNELGILEETNPLYTNQKFFTQLSSSDSILNLPSFTVNSIQNYITTRYVSSADYGGFVVVDNLYEWIQTNCKFDDNDYKFLNLKMRNVFDSIDVTTVEQAGSRIQFIGNICRNYNGDIHGINLRIIPYETKKQYVRVFLKFFYNKQTNAFQLWYDYFQGDPTDPRLEGQLLNVWRDYYKLDPLREFNWNKTRKEPLNLNERIFITEGIYDSLFLENSICAGGMVSTLVIPEKLRGKDLFFILDNNKTSGIYKTTTNLIRMGYSVFIWPKNMVLFKDFNEYVDYVYKYSDKTLTEEQYINTAKGYIRKLVYTDENIVNGGDLETYDKWFFDR